MKDKSPNMIKTARLMLISNLKELLIKEGVFGPGRIVCMLIR